ncbi:hypothetical protein FRB95_006348 [Tulasnella sp. JGI-2019a]|nr:hypothetical protein FRB95_006348 [Tulasnella sp. JGI-2019a]
MLSLPRHASCALWSYLLAGYGTRTRLMSGRVYISLERMFCTETIITSFTLTPHTYLPPQHPDTIFIHKASPLHIQQASLPRMSSSHVSHVVVPGLQASLSGMPSPHAPIEIRKEQVRVTTEHRGSPEHTFALVPPLQNPNPNPNPNPAI